MTMSTSLGSLSVFPSWVMGEYGFDAMVLMLPLLGVIQGVRI